MGKFLRGRSIVKSDRLETPSSCGSAHSEWAFPRGSSGPGNKGATFVDVRRDREEAQSASWSNTLMLCTSKPRLKEPRDTGKDLDEIRPERRKKEGANPYVHTLPTECIISYIYYNFRVYFYFFPFIFAINLQILTFLFMFSFRTAIFVPLSIIIS